MAPAAAAVAAAFVTLLKPRDELPDDVVDVAQLTSAVIDACRRHECDGTSDSEILKVTLELLQRKQSVDVQVLLLRLVRVLKMRKAWSLEEDSAVLSVLATLLLNVDAAGIPTIDTLASLISEIVEKHLGEEALDCINDAIQMALVQWATTPCAGAYRSLNAQQLTNWELKTSFDDVAMLLHDGSRFEQDTVLKCLLIYPGPIRESLIQSNEGGADLTLHVLKYGSSLAKALALAFAKDAALYSRSFRAQMLGIWWEHDQEQREQRRIATDLEARVFAAVSDLAVYGDHAFLQGLEQGEAYEQVIRVIDLKEATAFARRLCTQLNLLEVLSQLLSSRMDVITASAADVEITDGIWSLLISLLNSTRPLQATSSVVAGTQYVMRLAITILTTSERTPLWTLNALQVLCSPLLRAKRVRQVFIDSGAISSLVTLLAEQQGDTPLSRDLVVLLRDLAASNTAFADEVDQCGLMLCSDNNGGEPFLLDDQPKRHYHNLLLLYRDIPVLRLGRTIEVNKAINALAVAELLGSQGGSDIEKLLMVHSLHNELQLNGLDPVRCALDDLGEGANSVVNAVAENLDDFICLALYGPLDGRKAARRVLTVVARSDIVSRRKLRGYHSDPSRPALVAVEALETEAERCDSLDGGAQDEEQVVYEYSDDEGEEDEEENSDLSDQEEGQEDGQPGELTETTSHERPATVTDHTVGSAREETEVQDTLAAFSMDDDDNDWEII